jgi:hypothetical protein
MAVRELQGKQTTKRKFPFEWVGLALALGALVYPMLVPEPNIYVVAILVALCGLCFVRAAIDYFQSRRWKTISGTLTAIATLGLIYWRLAIPVTLNWTSTSNVGNYLAGTEIGGIKWEPQFSDLRVMITNPTDHDYDSFDFTVAPDAGIIRAGEVGSLGAKLISNSKLQDVYSSGVDPTTGKPFQQHWDHFITGSYRILCDKIPHGLTLQLVFATGDMNAILGYKTKATKVHVYGTYHVFGRTVSIDKTIQIKD